MSDNEILELFFQKDENALSALEKQYKPYCTAVAERILGDREDAEECWNDVLQKAWNSASGAKPDSLRLWLGKIARNSALTMLESQKAKKRDGGIKLQLDELSECIPAPLFEHEADRIALRDFMNGFIKILPEGEELWASLSFYFDETDVKSNYSVDELEEYIGLELCFGDEIREGINYLAERRKAHKTSLWPCSISVTGKKVSEAEGGFVPLCATISFIVDYDNKGNFVYGYVYICLSEEKTTATSVWNSYEKEGKWKEKIIKTDSGKDIYFIHNNPQEGFRSSARAYWAEDGIGYEAYAAMAYDWERKDEAVKYLKPFIENIE